MSSNEPGDTFEFSDNLQGVASQPTTPATYHSVSQNAMFFSQLSLKTTSNQVKVIFKISFNGDCKRIPQEREISYEDIIHRCFKSFSLDVNSMYLLQAENKTHIGS